MDDDLVGIETGLMRDRLSWVAGGSRELESLGSVEGGTESDLLGLLGLDAFEGCFGGGLGFLGGLFGV